MALGTLDAVARNFEAYTGIRPKGARPASSVKVADAQATDAATLDNDKADSGYQSVPSDDWLKADIQKWLDQAAIDYPSDATKAELLELVD